MKGISLIIFALTIDGLQAAISWAFLAIGTGLQAITPVGGGVGGAAAAAAYCWSTGGNIVESAVNAAQCAVAGGIFGAAIGAIGLPLGIAFGFAINVCLAAVMGSGLVILLIFSGMFYPKYLLPGGITELIPGLDCMPFWTIAVIASILKHSADEKKKEALGAVAAAMPPSSIKGKMALGIIGLNQQSMSRARRADPQTFIPLQEEAKEREVRERDPDKQATNQFMRDIRPRHI